MENDPTLAHNYHKLDDFRRAIYRAFIRPTWNERRRFFFEGDSSLIGQMWLAEREALYDAVLRRKPKRCFEIGTWTGGGSTYFIASALKEVGSGQLYTMEVNPQVHSIASTHYNNYLSSLNNHVTFLFGSDVTAFNPHVDHTVGVECFFLDGSDISEETVHQFRYFDALSQPGTIMMAHDWDDRKQAMLRPIIEADPRWTQRAKLTAPNSVGFVV